MLTFAIILLIVGAILLCIELVVPGFGVFGILGLLSLLASSVITIMVSPFGVIIVMSEVVLLAVVIVLLLKYVKQKQLYGKLILDETLDYEKDEIGDLNYFLGKVGFVKTPLKPFGTADFSGVVIEVCSDGPYILEKMEVKVIEVTKNKVIVSAVKLQ